MIERILNNIQKYLFFWVFGAIIAGLFVSNFLGGYSFSAVICLLAALLMIYPSLVPLAFDKLSKALQHKKIILLSVLVNFVVSPLAAFIIGDLFLSAYPVLRLGLFLLALLPGGGMVTTWAYKSKADMETTVGIVFANLLVAILVVPIGFSFMLNRLSTVISGAATENSGACLLSQASQGVVSCGVGAAGINPVKIIVPIFFIIVIPLALAFVTQRIIKKKKGEEYFAKIKNEFAQVSNLGLVVVLFVLMGLKENKILFQNYHLILNSILPLIFFYGINLLVAFGAYKYFYPNAEGKALVWGSYLRYITLALGLAISFIYQNPGLVYMVVVIVLAYFIQIPSSFWLAKKLQS